MHGKSLAPVARRMHQTVSRATPARRLLHPHCEVRRAGRGRGSAPRSAGAWSGPTAGRSSSNRTDGTRSRSPAQAVQRSRVCSKFGLPCMQLQSHAQHRVYETPRRRRFATVAWLCVTLGLCCVTVDATGAVRTGCRVCDSHWRCTGDMSSVKPTTTGIPTEQQRCW